MYFIINEKYKYCSIKILKFKITVMNSPEEYKNNLLKFDLQSFLTEYRGYNALKLKKIFPGIYKLLAAQLALYDKATKKLPLMANNLCYFTAKSYEQASSEALANYKASMVQGDLLIDLTGGLGADDIAFSGNFKKIISVDKDIELNILAQVNFSKLRINNVQRITSSAEEFITRNLKANLIYIDADRKPGYSGKKSVTLHDSSPDILKIINRLFEISPDIMLKLSPMADISYVKNSLPSLAEIHVVSVKNDVKELLVFLKKGFIKKPLVLAIDLEYDGNKKLNQFFDSGENKSKPLIAEKGKYFLEAANALIKSGLLNNYALENEFKLVSANSVFMITDKLINNPFGRFFMLVNSFIFSKSYFKKYISEKNITCSNITARSFPLKPEEIKSNFGLKDGGNDYFFFTTGEKKQKLGFHCYKLK